MKKFLKILFNVSLVIIVVLTGIWYAFGENGPLEGQFPKIAAEEEVEAPTVTISDEKSASSAEEELAVETKKTGSIVFTGDVEIGNFVKDNYDAKGIEGVLSQDLIDTLSAADVTMINNEFPYSLRGTPDAGKQYTFRLDPKYVSLITDLGVDVAGLANNHVLDYGTDALSDTLTTLKDAGVEYTGAGESLDDAKKLIIKTDEAGRTYGFLAASHIIPTADWDVRNTAPGVFTFYDSTALINEVKEDAGLVDYLFVMVHWGIENTTELEDYQVNEGHAIIDAGAAAVIGMHTHCLQAIEYYNGKPIFYSLGNFIFGQTIKEGAAVKADIDEEGNVNYTIIPVTAENGFTDMAVKSNSKIYDYIEGISENILIDDNGLISPK